MLPGSPYVIPLRSAGDKSNGTAIARRDPALWVELSGITSFLGVDEFESKLLVNISHLVDRREFISTHHTGWSTAVKYCY